jgi:YD repeat-containing protein
MYNDDNRLTSVTYGAVIDTYTYNSGGQRTRAYLNGTNYRVGAGRPISATADYLN